VGTGYFGLVRASDRVVIDFTAAAAACIVVVDARKQMLAVCLASLYTTEYVRVRPLGGATVSCCGLLN